MIQADKYEQAHFGHCPRVYCDNSEVLPVGQSDLVGLDTVKLFCPTCLDIYTPPHTRFAEVDGAFFGTSFAVSFFIQYPELNPSSMLSDMDGTYLSISSPVPRYYFPGSSSLKNCLVYRRKIFGFNVSERAKDGPRMSWLRERPDGEDLDLWFAEDEFSADVYNKTAEVLEKNRLKAADGDKRSDEDGMNDVEKTEIAPPAPPFDILALTQYRHHEYQHFGFDPNFFRELVQRYSAPRRNHGNEDGKDEENNDVALVTQGRVTRSHTGREYVPMQLSNSQQPVRQEA